MVGNWEHRGSGGFILDPTIPAERYVWRAPKSLGGYLFRFECPNDGTPRRFHSVDVLEAWKQGEPAFDHANRMCQLGLKLLAQWEVAFRQWFDAAPQAEAGYEGKEMPTRDNLAFLLAIFESRREGRALVTRRLDRGEEFFDKKNEPDDTLVPGVSLEDAQREQLRSSRQFIDHVTKTVSSRRDRVAPSVQPTLELSLSESPMRTPLDHLLVEGTLRRPTSSGPPSFSAITQGVAQAIINGLNVEADSAFIQQNIEDFRHFTLRLLRAFFQKKDRFPAWLRQEREKGLVRLLPASSGNGEAERDKARRFYRRLLWTAHEAMSRCYGVAALLMWMDFTDSELILPSPEEKQLFRNLHAPVAYAGGLPLSFFAPGALRWIVEPLIEDWLLCGAGEQFDRMTELLNIYGVVAEDRRKWDRSNKDRKRHQRGYADHNPQTTDIETLEGNDGSPLHQRVRVDEATPGYDGGEEAYPELSPSHPCCCRCGGSLTLLDSRGENGARQAYVINGESLLVEAECLAPSCGLATTYRVRLNEGAC
ncbi:MAG: hypothetical protein LC104_05100 [Bacteroidales bacterium]|nr:hypothetical protein [Bacteroidales bacterium]